MSVLCQSGCLSVSCILRRSVRLLLSLILSSLSGGARGSASGRALPIGDARGRDRAKVRTSCGADLPRSQGPSSPHTSLFCFLPRLRSHVPASHALIPRVPISLCGFSFSRTRSVPLSFFRHSNSSFLSTVKRENILRNPQQCTIVMHFCLLIVLRTLDKL